MASPPPATTVMELLRALGSLTEPPTPETVSVCRALGLEGSPSEAEHNDLFLFQLYPYGSVYLGAEGMMGGEARDRVAGFWRALGLDPPAEPDHLALMLAFQARLAELEAAAEVEETRRRWRRARAAFLHEHLLSWLPVYLDRVEEIGEGVYPSWARLLAAVLAREAETVADSIASPDSQPASALPLHLREAPEMPDPREVGGEAFLEALLAPARSGLLLVRADLQRAGRELSMAVRQAERRYALRGLFAQRPAATLEWLGRMARRAALRAPALSGLPPEVAGHWAARAGRTAGLLATLVEDLPTVE